MSIRARFTLTMILFGAILIGASLVEIVVSRMTAAAERDEQTADDIIRDTGDLSYAADSYIIYREAGQLERWKEGLARLSRDISRLGTGRPDLNAIVRGISSSRQRLEEAFDSIIASGTESKALQVSWSRIAVLSQDLIAEADLLSRQLREVSDTLQSAGSFAVLGMAIVFVGYFAFSSIIFQRRILGSLAALQRGAAALGSGDLGFRIDEGAHSDEMADLARAFNRMGADLKKIDRTLRMVGECNQALVRARDEESLVREICRIASELGGYRMAWVGYAEHDAEKTVRPVGSVGFDRGYIENACISWADTERGRGPTGSCIRLAEVQYGRDFLTDPSLEPWKEEALARGYRSSIALPLMNGSEAFGAFTIYADVPSAFDGAQSKLLMELADDLAFGILVIRARAERDAALRIAEERTGQLRTLAAELGRAERNERRRLSSVLHDNLQQVLVGSKYFLSALKGDPSQSRDVERIGEMLDEAVSVTRSLATELSPPALYEEGLVMGLESLVRDMRKKHDLVVELHAGEDVEPRNEDIRVLLYDAVRELLFNVVKHAGVREAQVELERRGNGWLRIMVSDRGKGCAEPVCGESGLGLFSIRERLGYLGGSLSIESAPGEGTRVTMDVSG